MNGRGRCGPGWFDYRRGVAARFEAMPLYLQQMVLRHAASIRNDGGIYHSRMPPARLEDVHAIAMVQTEMLIQRARADWNTALQAIARARAIARRIDGMKCPPPTRGQARRKRAADCQQLSLW